MTLFGFTSFHPQMGDVSWHEDDFCDGIKEYYSRLDKPDEQIDGLVFIRGLYTSKNFLRPSDSSMIIPVKVSISVTMQNPMFKVGRNIMSTWRYPKEEG